MLLRSGRATSSTRPRRRCGGSTTSSSFNVAAGRPRRLKRKSSSGEVDSAPRRSKSPPPSPCRQPPNRRCCSDSDEASAAALGIKMFPELPPDTAAEIWVSFVRNAKTCIDHYNNTHQEASFVYKHALDNGSILAGERDGRHYYHLNFIAEDKKGHSQLFFGEIRVRVAPKVEDVTCCCPVSPSDAGGKSIRTIEEAVKFEFPAWGTAGMDQEHCYACPSRVKHRKGRATSQATMPTLDSTACSRTDVLGVTVLQK